MKSCSSHLKWLTLLCDILGTFTAYTFRTLEGWGMSFRNSRNIYQSGFWEWLFLYPLVWSEEFWHRTSVSLFCTVVNTSEFFQLFFRVCKPYRLYLVCFIWTPPKYLPPVPFIGTLRCCIFASLSEVVLAPSVMVLHVAAGVAWHDVLGVSVVYLVSSCTLFGWLALSSGFLFALWD